MRGMAGTIGARPLAALCAQLEEEAVGAAPPDAEGLLLAIEQEFRRVKLAVEQQILE